MFTVNSERDRLLNPLMVVSGIIGRRHTLPILSNIMIGKEGNKLTFLSTDLDIEAKTSVEDVGGLDEGSITVNAKKLQEILRSFPSNVPIDLAVDEQRMTIKSGRSRFSLQTLPAENFPRISENLEKRYTLSLQQRFLRYLVNQTQIAMALQDVRYYLNGVLCVVEDGYLRTVSTDGHRLAHAAIKLDVPTDDRYEVILPRKTVLELHRLIGDSEAPVEITLSSNQAHFYFSGISLISKLIDGKFPDYKRVIPSDTKNQFTVVRQLLLQALLRVKILTDDKLNGVRVVISDNVMSINSVNVEQEEAVEEIEISYQGPSLDMGFNINYLLDVLNNVTEEAIEWHCSDAASSVMITIPKDDNFKYVVMPMRI